MKTAILCEGTTDLLMIQFILQYKYKWRYSGFLENAETNRLIKRTLRKNKSVVEIENCRGIMKIPEKLREIKDLLELAARPEEMFDKVIVLIDHDTVSSNKEFIDKVNENLGTHFQEKDINVETKWIINNVIWGEKEIDIFIRCLPETQIGAIEKIMLEALATDEIECNLIDASEKFINKMSKEQTRYLQKKSLICKAIFNTYFAIRAPEEKYDDRARILRAYDWENNEVLNSNFSFLDIECTSEFTGQTVRPDNE